MLDAKFGKGSMFGEAIKRLGLSTVENDLLTLEEAMNVIILFKHRIFMWKKSAIRNHKICFTSHLWNSILDEFSEKFLWKMIFSCWGKLKVGRKHRKKSWLAIFQADRKTKIDEVIMSQRSNENMAKLEAAYRLKRANLCF